MMLVEQFAIYHEDSMPKLSFISDEDFYTAIKAVFQIAEAAKNKSEAEFGKNVIDPFSALFEMAGFSYDQTEWLKNEKTRQAQKTLANSIGSFHQMIIGALPGWKWHANGGIIDVSNDEKKVVAEVKNKFNTTKGDSKYKIYDTLADAILPKQTLYKGYAAYYVEVIPSRPVRYDKVFTPSDNKTGLQRPANELIRQIDGYSFYHLATGIPDALEQIYLALPDAIEKVMPSIKISEHDRGFGLKYFKDAYTILPKTKKSKN